MSTFISATSFSSFFVMKGLALTLITLISTPFGSYAQTIAKQHDSVEKPSVSNPRFFVGLHVFRGNYAVFFPSGPNGGGADSWQLTTGVTVAPRLTLQAGYVYGHTADDRDPVYTGTSLTGDFVSGSSANERWTHCVSSLARYEALRFFKPRLRVDALVGLTFLQTRDIAAGEERVNYQVVNSYYSKQEASDLYATAGVGVRCPFGRHLEGIFDWTYSRNFHAAPEYVHQSVARNKYGLTRALSLGLRYRFNLKKLATAAP